MFGLSGIQAESYICLMSNAQTMPCQLQLLLSSSTTCRLAMLPWHITQPALPDLVTHKRHTALAEEQGRAPQLSPPTQPVAQ